MPLKDVEIRAMKAAPRPYKRTDERGLYIEVRPSGAKLWRFKYNHLGKDNRIARGSYPEVGLAEARRKRDEARAKVREGVDPLADRKREKLAPIAKRAVTDLKPLDVFAALKRIEAKGKHETARRCRSFASRVFRYAVAPVAQKPIRHRCYAAH